MRRWLLTIALSLGIAAIAYPTFSAVSLAQTLSGRILLQVQAKGAVWYVYPVTKQRYSLGTATNATTVIRKLSLPVSQSVFDAIPTHGSGLAGNATIRNSLSGRIIRLSATSDMWYVSPLTKEKYFLDNDPLPLLKSLSLGISDTNINLIPVASGFDAPKVPVNGLLRKQQNVSTPLGTFLIDVATLDLDHTTLKIATDTAQNNDCKNNCATYPLKSFTGTHHAVFGMHGTYFCPPDYASCAGQVGSYYYPVVNTFSRVMVNGSRLKYTNEPMVTFDFNNTPKFYHHAKDFLGSNLFASINLSNVQAAISNGPALIENGKNVANPAAMDTKQRTVKSYRGVLGWKGRTMYFFIVRGATVTDSAAVAEALGLDYALNLDGGGSTAMVQNGAYVLGPGRNLPNVIELVP